MKNSGFSLGIFSYMQHPLSSRKRHHDRRSSRPKSPVREACRRRKTRSHDTLRGRRSIRSPTLHRITRASGAPARKAPAAGVEEADGGRGAHVEAFARGLDRNVEATVGSLKARIGDAWSLGAHQPANGALGNVVRREEDGIRRYLHLGTGNYNDSTAKIYTDLGLFTCNEQFGADASSLFNVITGYSRPPEYKHFIVAPHGMRSFFEYMIRQETENAKKGLPSGITVKVNSLVDPKIIELLYEASKAGVRVQLIVRGICCLIPGIEGVSENITVMSIVGQLLEHSRIFRFENAGNPRIYMGSADWMPRNLDRRVELVFPIDDETQKARAFGILDTMLSDTTNARFMQIDTSYEHVDLRGKKKISSQLTFYHEAQARLKELQSIEKDSVLIPIHSAEE